MQSLFSPIAEETFPRDHPVEKQPKQPNPTKTEKPLDSTDYEQLDDLHKLATQLRAKWLPYKKVVTSIEDQFGKKYTEAHLRTWFMVGGKCKKALEYLEKLNSEQSEKDNENALGMLRQRAIEAIGLLGEGMVDNSLSENQIKTAQDILDRAGYPRVSKTENDHKVNVSEIRIATDALVAIAENKK